MTLDEFRQETLDKLLHASSAPDARSIVASASDTLNRSDIQTLHKRQFWSELYSSLNKRWIVERQGVSSLSAIIAAAQSAVAEYLAAANSEK